MAKHRIRHPYREPVVQPQDQYIKLIALTHSKTAIIDATDYKSVNEVHWHSFWNKCTRSYYARASCAGVLKGVLMHRYILGVSDPKIEVDHLNGNTLDNRRENLRIATREQNRQNRGPYKNTKSGYAGVFWHKRDERWSVYINANGTRIHCGYFKELQAAIERRKAAEIEFHGNFAFCKRNIKH